MTDRKMEPWMLRDLAELWNRLCEREGPDSAADDMLYQRIVFAEKAVHMDYLTVGFTLADVRDAQSAMRNAAKKLRVEGYPATADDLDHHANLLDGGAK